MFSPCVARCPFLQPLEQHPTIVSPFFSISSVLCSFCPSLAVIAGVLRLSDNIAGVTILAFGNGAPDIFTSLASGADEGIIMFTELIGAGVFVTAIIAGSVAVVKPFRVLLKPLMRDACFYIVTVCWISYVIRDGTIHLWEAVSTYVYTLLSLSLLLSLRLDLHCILLMTKVKLFQGIIGRNLIVLLKNGKMLKLITRVLTATL